MHVFASSLTRVQYYVLVIPLQARCGPEDG